jgi:hypothetical protein
MGLGQRVSGSTSEKKGNIALSTRTTSVCAGNVKDLMEDLEGMWGHMHVSVLLWSVSYFIKFYLPLFHADLICR